MLYWNNLDKIFLANAKTIHTTNYGPVTKDWIKENNPPYLELRLACPICNIDQGQSLVWSKMIRYYRTGEVEEKYLYNSTFANIDNKTIISTYGNRLLGRAVFKQRENGDMKDDKCNCINDQQ